MKLSIITVNRNNVDGLRKTIESVVSQTFTDFEYIIIDGASTDGSVDVIKEYAHKIDFWVSEPDTGIYNAMNKGILKAKGEYLLFLNSGDKLSKSESITYFDDYLNNGYDIIYGDIKVGSSKDEFLKTYPDELNFRYFLYDTLPHPASLIKTKSLMKLGNYDENLKICADWKFFIESICLHNYSYKHINNEISTFYLDGISSENKSLELIEIEKLSVLTSSFVAFYSDYIEMERLVKFKQRIHKSLIIKFIVKLGFLKRTKYE